jgi:hypothetical protein
MKIPPGSRHPHPHPHPHSLPHGLLLRGCLVVSVMLLVVAVARIYDVVAHPLP